MPKTPYIFGVVSMFAATACLAQSTPQDRLYSEARDAHTQGDYQQAIVLYRQALSHGEVGELYAYIGDAYLDAQQCKEAEEAYKKAESSSVKRSPELLQTWLEARRVTIAKTCLGTLVFECVQQGLTVQLDDKNPVSCSALGATELPPGFYTITGKNRDTKVTVNVSVTGLRQNNVRFDLPAPPEKIVREQVEVEAPVDTESWGWIVVATGATVLVGTVVADVFVLDPALDDYTQSVDDYNTLRQGTDYEATISSYADVTKQRNDTENLQTTLITTYAIGAGLTAVGVGLLANGWWQESDTQTSQWVPTLQSNGAELSGVWLW